VVIVTHDIELLLKYADYAVFLSKGKIIDSLDSDHFLQMSQYLIKLGIDVPEILSLVEGLTNMDNSIKPAHALKALKDYSAAVRLCLNCCKRMS
jgi:energy-coupling factor transporter ATP-binding protein EcfA2